MASIQVRKETNRLIIDFYVNGQRCREQTALSDTPANRKKLEKLLERIEADIKFGTCGIDVTAVLVETDDVVPGRHDIAPIAGHWNGWRIGKNEADADGWIQSQFRDDGHEIRSVGTESMHPDDRPCAGFVRLEFDRFQGVCHGPGLAILLISSWLPSCPPQRS